MKPCWDPIIVQLSWFLIKTVRSFESPKSVWKIAEAHMSNLLENRINNSLRVPSGRLGWSNLIHKFFGGIREF